MFTRSFGSRVVIPVVLAAVALSPKLTWGAYIGSVATGPMPALNGATFKVRVVINGAAYTGSHYVRATMTATGGFNVQSPSTQSVTHLNGGASKTLEFTVRAPNRDSTGFLTVKTTWSSVYSGAGTISSSNGGATVSCKGGWQVSVQLLNPHGILAGNEAGDPTAWTLTRPGYSSTKLSSTAPYYVTFTIPATPGSYTISGTWWLLSPPWMPIRSPDGDPAYPRGESKTVYISRSGMVITF